MRFAGKARIETMLTSDFHYSLPGELIAQEPPARRESARMMVLERGGVGVQHRQVTALPEYLRPGDLLVLNDTRVFPARLVGKWQDSSGAVELLLVEQKEVGGDVWRCMVGSGRPVRVGQAALLCMGQVVAEFLQVAYEGAWWVRLVSDEPLMALAERYGLMPLPPYIKRAGDAGQARMDRQRYQTVYARAVGAVAAPTAGLHFTPELLGELQTRGVGVTTVTLHVGPGTFKPVKSVTVEEHRMDAERYEISQEAATAITRCRARGGRVVAVGSTSVRTVESVAAQHDGVVEAGVGRSQLFIYPPYKFRVTDAMLTNFHLPQSTLLMMVAALVGRERVLAAYREAVVERYRFFSYGDCMLIL